jgi:N-acetylmuramoyl-L-alanine amidase
MQELVGDLTISEALTPQKIRIAAETVWGEARGEPWLGKVAVAWVIRNRVEQPAWWGRDIIGVCTKPWQFSCRNANDPNSEKLAKVSDDDPVFMDCRDAVEAAFLGTEPDPTKGASHYKVLKTRASWDHAVRHMTPTIIGHHAFYKLGPKG